MTEKTDSRAEPGEMYFRLAPRSANSVATSTTRLVAFGTAAVVALIVLFGWIFEQRQTIFHGLLEGSHMVFQVVTDDGKSFWRPALLCGISAMAAVWAALFIWQVERSKPDDDALQRAALKALAVFLISNILFYISFAVMVQIAPESTGGYQAMTYYLLKTIAWWPGILVFIGITICAMEMCG